MEWEDYKDYKFYGDQIPSYDQHGEKFRSYIFRKEADPLPGYVVLEADLVESSLDPVQFCKNEIDRYESQ